MPSTAARFPYDIFISHQRADKDWARRLAARLGDVEYNGRKLRPWLDEAFLDPGTLSSDAELTTALDRSRLLAVVMTPEATASRWVDLEIRHFLESRQADDVILLARRDCAIPDALKSIRSLDVRGEEPPDQSLRLMMAALCPQTPETPEDVERTVDRAFEAFLAADPGGFIPGPTPERDAVSAELLRHDIDDSGSEGLAIAAFLRAAGHVRETRAAESAAAYSCKMLLGECLAVAVHRSPNYRQVVSRFLDIAATLPDDPSLLFVVARAYSKLAEIDIRLVDTSAVLRAVSQLDSVSRGNEVEAIVAMFVRVTGKLRDSTLGELLIRTLADRGRASRIVAAGAIALSYELSGPVFYLSELQRLHEGHEERALPKGPPSKRLIGELSEIDLDQDESVRRATFNARDELRSAYPGTGTYYRASWFFHRPIDATIGQSGTPFTGTLVKATLADMTDLGDRLHPAAVACLTEPRVVDALFEACGGLLILQQEIDSPQCRRLRARRVPFAMVAPDAMAQLPDSAHVVVDERHIRVLPA